MSPAQRHAVLPGWRLDGAAAYFFTRLWYWLWSVAVAAGLSAAMSASATQRAEDVLATGRSSSAE
jgi:hypothetical protein